MDICVMSLKRSLPRVRPLKETAFCLLWLKHGDIES